MRLLRKLSTIRHGRGFGVHSPLAFTLIYSVLRDKPQYYLDAKINRLFPNKRSRRIGRIIIRLVSYFNPETAFSDTIYKDVIPMVRSDIQMVSNPLNSEFAVTENQGHVTITVGMADENTNSLVLDNEKDLKIIIYRKGLSPTLVNTIL